MGQKYTCFQLALKSIQHITVAALQLITLCFTATPVGTTIPEIQGTMDLLPEIIHTENIQIPVPEMTMAQCLEDTGMSVD